MRDNIEKLMECPVCLERLQSPVACCFNGHPLCPKCSKSIRSCPLCQSIFTAGQNTFINQLIASFPFKCKFALEGCEELAAPEFLTVHEKKCEYRHVDCPLLTSSSTECFGLVTVRSYSAHVLEHHQSYITTYDARDWEYSGVLPKNIDESRINCYYSVLKDSWKDLCFIVMIYYDTATKIYQLTVHYLGKDSEASKYIYTIKLQVEGHFNELIYSTKCLPNIMSPEEAKKYDPFEIRDIDGRISRHKDEIKFSLKIKNVEDYKKYRHLDEITVLQVPKKRKTLDVNMKSDNHKTSHQSKEGNLKEINSWVEWVNGFPEESL